MALSLQSFSKPDPSINPKRRAKSKPSNPDTSSLPLIEPPPGLFPSSGPDLLRLIVVLAVAASVAVASNYVATFLNRRPKPFCDSTVDFDFSLYYDSCKPCPSFGECHEGKLECARGYRKVGKLCVEDGDIIETANKLSELLERRICEAYAQYLCGGAGAAWIQEGKLWNVLDEFMLKGNRGSDLYAYAKQRVIETTSKSLESRTSVEGVKELKCPQLLVGNYMPITCLARRWIAEHTMILVPLCALLIGSALIIFRLRQRFYLSSRAEQLYSQVCEILEEHALTSRNSNSEGEPWVVASWLRDHLLLPKERKDSIIWKKVEELVQEDSRLDRYPKIVKGESKVVWEWQVEGSLRSSRKRKKVEESKLKESEGIVSTPKQNRWRRLVSC